MGKAGIRHRLIAGGLATTLILQRLKVMQAARGLGGIFTLHQVRPYEAKEPDPNRHLEITPQFLAVALRTLWRENYEFIRLDQVPERLAQPARNNRPFAAFTLDDAYINTRSMALPVFEHFEAPFTTFVCQGLSNRSHTLWWETLAALVRKADQLDFAMHGKSSILAAKTPAQKQQAFNHIAACINTAHEAEAIHTLNRLALHHGIDSSRIVEDSILSTADLRDFAAHPLVSLGAHGLSHRALVPLNDDELQQEIATSLDYVEALSGQRPTGFAYPYGDARSIDARTIAAVRNAGLALGVTTRPGTLTADHYGTLHSLPRISLNGHFQTPACVKALASGIPFRLFPC
ncbi:peptidoglycan/xylan/chitin deacetylase (PgdA/CDA1 family) [Agrobacterium vitis]|nr:peptidoglycan/xylan/chitin deacetylase (PgdA/CDA1 family) [Agrobacterium vitis]MBE1438079.1 peptidoglycan/xylan/chitin deacetylase (PgdA/CDA1 family) [Agrobacterium vitis]